MVESGKSSWFSDSGHDRKRRSMRPLVRLGGDCMRKISIVTLAGFVALASPAYAATKAAYPAARTSCPHCRKRQRSSDVTRVRRSQFQLTRCCASNTIPTGHTSRRGERQSRSKVAVLCFDDLYTPCARLEHPQRRCERRSDFRCCTSAKSLVADCSLRSGFCR